MPHTFNCFCSIDDHLYQTNSVVRDKSLQVTGWEALGKTIPITRFVANIKDRPQRGIPSSTSYFLFSSSSTNHPKPNT